MRGPSGRIFLDLVLLLVAVLLLLPKSPEEDKTTEPPGQIIIEARWPDRMDADVDLWARGPEGQAVGYSSKHSPSMNLLRDDTGLRGDPSGLNYEFIFSRGAPAGEYIVNLHGYRLPSEGATVQMRVLLRNPHNNYQHVIYRGAVHLRDRQELTVVRFSLDSNGKLVANSVHDTPHGIRNHEGSAP